LEDKGGWRNRDSAGWFADYTRVVAERFHDRIAHWCTLNEPQVFIGLAMREGLHAPGLKLPDAEYLAAAHNAMRAHGRSAQILRTLVKEAKIGYVIATQPCRPATPTAEDVEAARVATFSVRERHSWNNTWWTDPILLGRYPEDGMALYGKDLPNFPDADFAEMKQPLDFLGLNLYSAETYRRGPDGKPERVRPKPGQPRTLMEYQLLAPDAMYFGPKFFHDAYHLPIIVTEAGVPGRDHRALDGKIHDGDRVDFLHRSLFELGRAIQDGVPVQGFMHWSLLDNFEWNLGYRERFGLVYVDYETQRRTPKDSYDFYAKVIGSQGRNLLTPTKLKSIEY